MVFIEYQISEAFRARLDLQAGHRQLGFQGTPLCSELTSQSEYRRERTPRGHGSLGCSRRAPVPVESRLVLKTVPMLTVVGDECPPKDMFKSYLPPIACDVTLCGNGLSDIVQVKVSGGASLDWAGS